MSSAHKGSSLEQHEQDMKVSGLEKWLFGAEGSTQLPTPRPKRAPAAAHDSHSTHAAKPSAAQMADGRRPAEHGPKGYTVEANAKGLEAFLFGETGSTTVPIPVAKSEHHQEVAHVSAAAAPFFANTAEASTDKALQDIRRERTGVAEELTFDVPEGYAPVTFIEADTIIIAPIGSNLRELALKNNIELYSDVAKVLNCRGLGLCTSCRVTVDPAVGGVSEPTPMEKEHLIRDNPKMRLSCQCEVTGPVKISTKPARDYGKVMNNLVKNSALFGIFSLVMLAILLVMGLDIVGVWF